MACKARLFRQSGLSVGCYLVLTISYCYAGSCFENVREDIYSKPVSQFKSKTRTMRYLPGEIHYADDGTLVAHSAEDMQLLIDYVARAASQFSLKINITKTECLYQPAETLRQSL